MNSITFLYKLEKGDFGSTVGLISYRTRLKNALELLHLSGITFKTTQYDERRYLFIADYAAAYKLCSLLYTAINDSNVSDFHVATL